jgi:nucleotide-binding universal stress UspA family protein
MTKVLIAADSSATSVEIARVAHRLFGDSAEYLVVNVDEAMDDAMVWGAAYPMVMPLPLPSDDPEAKERAGIVASDVAKSAELPGAESIGDVGDPAFAIMEAAHRHKVDVVVVGSHKHSWFTRLFTGSVSSDLLREADIPVLVVK